MNRSRSRPSTLGMLHNMSCPPRTTVVCGQRTVYGPLVVFSLTSILQRASFELPPKRRQRLMKKGILGLRDQELRSALEPLVSPGFLDSDLGRVPAPWPGVLIGRRSREAHPQGGTSIHLDDILCCSDPELVIHVLSRCENGLYIGHRTPSGGLLELCERATGFDDPRIARLDCIGPWAARVWPCDEDEATRWEETRSTP